MRGLTHPPASVAVLVLLWISVACQTGPPVPRVQLVPSGSELATAWSLATIVAVGTVGSPHRVGVPQLVTRGSTSGPVFPCEAQFHAAVLIKSEAGLGNRKLLWFSMFPTCGFGIKPDWTIRSAEQLWFLRTEDTWLRPVTDVSGTFLELYQHFEAPPNSDSETLRRTLSRYVLNPTAAAETEEQFVRRFNGLFDLSCKIAGEQWSRQVMGELRKVASPAVRTEICRLLAGYDQCHFSDCPPGFIYPGTDGTRGDQDQAAHKKSNLVESSEELLKARLKSGQPKEWEQHELEILSCNFDPVIRQRAGKLLRKYFPESQLAPCISCR